MALPWDDAADAPVYDDPLRGTLCIGPAGCDELRILVVTGEAAGTVWTFVPSHDHELHPEAADFLDWVLEGVDRRIADEERRGG